MRLFVAYNGWLGYSGVSVLVVAPDEATARRAASEAFRHVAVATGKPITYWQPDGLTVEELCPDTTREWIGPVGESDF